MNEGKVCVDRDRSKIVSRGDSCTSDSGSNTSKRTRTHDDDIGIQFFQSTAQSSYCSFTTLKKKEDLNEFEDHVGYSTVMEKKMKVWRMVGRENTHPHSHTASNLPPELMIKTLPTH